LLSLLCQVQRTGGPPAKQIMNGKMKAILKRHQFSAYRLIVAIVFIVIMTVIMLGK